MAVFVVLHIPVMLWLLPYGADVGQWIVGLVDRPVAWFGESLLGFDEVVRREGGSGDTAHDWSRTVLFLLLAGVLAALWTMAARRQAAPTLLSWVYVFLRYGLGLAMVQYGLVKVLPSQFVEPQGDLLLIPLGEASAMGLLWRYMGFSHAFNIVTGAVEILGGVLLFFRRTWLVGALVSVIAMTQVVAINFAFDVPVKIFSSQLLATALVLLVPFRHRLATALFTSRAVPADTSSAAAVPDRLRPFKTPAKVVLMLVSLGFMINGAWQGYNEWGRGADFALAGIYDVQSSSEPESSAATVVSIDHRKRMSLWHEVGQVSSLRNYGVELEDDVLILTDFSGPAGRLQLTRSSVNRIMLDGNVRGRDISMSLVERPPPELLRRGFHWVSEYPFSR